MVKYRCKNQAIGEKKKARKKWIAGTSVRFGLALCIAALGVLYIAQTSTASTKGYTISELEQEIAALETDVRAVDVEISQYRSMASIQERLVAMDLVAVDSVEYVAPVGTAVARR